MSTNNERYELNKNLAQMLKGGVIMDVTTPEQAKIAEAAGACAVMALERIPADIRAAGGVSRMSDPKFQSLLWPNAESDILQKLRYFRQLKSTILMKAKSFHLQMMSTILTKESLVFHLSAVQKILAKHLDVSMKELL